MGSFNSKILGRPVEVALFKSDAGPREKVSDPAELIKSDENSKFQIKLKPGFYMVSLQNSPDAYGEEIPDIKIVPGNYSLVLPASYLCEIPTPMQEEKIDKKDTPVAKEK
ncbi:MAG: hypothetical protein A2161_01705 [Candidatus Schekmanbacteria bacterium RBG_13_48_7]|uniref:Uncharacterized protein n=1 Tax=Candidatus Schekmanbacteria bacterium RBG_13_48_7 TaxID=1817878 RepID=A0A1F7RMC2_9BACT|nr:MAG: hypothetical protein A2161_01705 [Candidatus Schekmanbacteria bacterium RBG_13_48_7]